MSVASLLRAAANACISTIGASSNHKPVVAPIGVIGGVVVQDVLSVPAAAPGVEHLTYRAQEKSKQSRLSGNARTSAPDGFKSLAHKEADEIGHVLGNVASNQTSNLPSTANGMASISGPSTPDIVDFLNIFGRATESSAYFASSSDLSA